MRLIIPVVSDCCISEILPRPERFLRKLIMLLTQIYFKLTSYYDGLCVLYNFMMAAKLSCQWQAHNIMPFRKNTLHISSTPSLEES